LPAPGGPALFLAADDLPLLAFVDARKRRRWPRGTAALPDRVAPTGFGAGSQIRVEAVGNVFFDLSDADLTLRDSHEQLAALLEASAGVGSGGSLAAKARVAAAKWAAGNLAGACDSLAAYLEELADQTGKTVTPAQAAELAALAMQIRAVIGC
jgi:hypothetical protein